MNRFVCVAAFTAITALLALVPRPGFAVGFGIYGSGSVGTMSISVSSKSESSRAESERIYAASAGLIIDTAPAKDKLFNYRLQLGYGKLFDDQTGPFDKFAFHKLEWINTFGFGFYRRPSVRVWAGPSVSMTYFRQTTSTTDGTIIPLPPAVMFDIIKMKTELNHVQLNVGGVLGVNFNPGDHVTIGWEIGFQGGFGFGKARASGSEFISNFPIPFSLSGSTDLTSTNIEAFTRLSFMIRVGDTFRGKESKPIDERL